MSSMYPIIPSRYPRGSTRCLTGEKCLPPSVPPKSLPCTAKSLLCTKKFLHMARTFVQPVICIAASKPQKGGTILQLQHQKDSYTNQNQKLPFCHQKMVRAPLVPWTYPSEHKTVRVHNSTPRPLICRGFFSEWTQIEYRYHL